VKTIKQLEVEMDHRNNPLHKFVLSYLVEITNSIQLQSDPVFLKTQLATYTNFYRKLPEEYQEKLGLPLPLPYKVDYDLMTLLFETEEKVEKTRGIRAWFWRKK